MVREFCLQTSFFMFQLGQFIKTKKENDNEKQNGISYSDMV